MSHFPPPARRPRLFSLLLALTLAPLALLAAPRAEFSSEDRELIEKRWPDAGQTPSGIRYVIDREGDGPKPKSRQRLSVLYRGSLLDGKVFSEQLDRDKPFTFTIGSGQVILGWEESIMDMRVGEKRTIILPYALGYGLRGREPDIPNRATLVFEVELLAIQ